MMKSVLFFICCWIIIWSCLFYERAFIKRRSLLNRSRCLDRSNTIHDLHLIKKRTLIPYKLSLFVNFLNTNLDNLRFITKIIQPAYLLVKKTKFRLLDLLSTCTIPRIHCNSYIWTLRMKWFFIIGYRLVLWFLYFKNLFLAYAFMFWTRLLVDYLF